METTPPFIIKSAAHEVFYQRVYNELTLLITALSAEAAEEAALEITANYFREQEELDRRYNLIETP